MASQSFGNSSHGTRGNGDRSFIECIGCGDRLVEPSEVIKHEALGVAMSKPCVEFRD